MKTGRTILQLRLMRSVSTRIRRTKYYSIASDLYFTTSYRRLRYNKVASIGNTLKFGGLSLRSSRRTALRSRPPISSPRYCPATPTLFPIILSLQKCNMMLICPTDDMESMVELMVVYVGRDVCGGRWAGLVVRGFVLNVPICNRTAGQRCYVA
jgi:hypothetical protein